MKKIINLYIPLIFLGLVIFVAIFPVFTTSSSPSQKHLQDLIPNLGINSFQIENLGVGLLKIDSLYIGAGDKKVYIIIDSEVDPNSSITGEFKIKNLSLASHNGDFNLYLFPKVENKVIVTFNDFDRRFIFRTGRGRTTIPRILFWSIDRNNQKSRFWEASLLGSDNSGRDTWSRLIYGSGIIMKIVILSVLISVPIGVILGLFHGFYENNLSKIINLFVNLGSSIPVYLLTMLVVAVFGQRIFLVVIAFSLVQWVEIEKMIYHKVISIKRSEFILAAKSFGKSNLNIIFSELLILCLPEILIGTIFLAKRIILIEAGLSFLDYSVNIPYPSWGSIIAGARQYIMHERAFWLILPPTLAIIGTANALNSLGIYLKERYINV